MPAERGRREAATNQFDIVFIPVGQGGKSRTYRLSRLKLLLLFAGVFCVVVLFTVGALMFTPLALIIPFPNPILEEKYGRELLETQKELRALAQDVQTVREYNTRLRKIFGERQDSATTAQENTDVEPTFASASDSILDLGDGGTPYEGFGQEDHSFGTLVPSAPVIHATLPFINPVGGIISQKFDPERMHFGVDFAAKAGTPVFAAGDGYVVFSGWTYDGGNMIMISHNAGYISVYKHNQSLLMAAHVPVRRGDVVALLGSSGKTSTGPHLHFELWKNGVPVDPLGFLLTTTEDGTSGAVIQ